MGRDLTGNGDGEYGKLAAVFVSRRPTQRAHRRPGERGEITPMCLKPALAGKFEILSLPSSFQALLPGRPSRVGRMAGLAFSTRVIATFGRACGVGA